MCVVKTLMEESKKFPVIMEVENAKNRGEKKKKLAACFANKFSEVLKPKTTHTASKLQNTHQSSCYFFQITHQFHIQIMTKFNTFS